MTHRKGTRHRYGPRQLRQGDRDGARWRVRVVAGVLAGVTAVALTNRAQAASAQQATAPAATASALVFDGVTVVDVERGQLRPGQRVVIAGTRIQAVGTRSVVALPAGAQVIDARGKYLIPGLWDMGVRTGPASSDGFLDSIVPFTYKALLANGVTGIRNESTGAPLATLRQWRQEILAGTRLGPPRQILTGPDLVSNSSGDGVVQRGIRDPAEAQQVVDSLKAAGVDMIKPAGVSREEYFALAAAARRAGLPISGPTPNLTALEASDSGMRLVSWVGALSNRPSRDSKATRSDIDCTFSDSARVPQCRTVADRFRRNDTWVVTATYPAAFHAFDAGLGPKFWRPREHPGDALGQIMHQDIKQFLNRVAQSPDSAWYENWLQHAVRSDPHGRLRVMQQVGMPLLAGTGAGGFMYDHWWLFTGFATHVQLAMDVMEGLTPLAALQAATLNPAKALHATDSLGTVAPGKLADLVLLDANPLEEISNTAAIRAVVANGRYYDRVALNQLLREIRGEAVAEVKAVYRQVAKAVADKTLDWQDIWLEKVWEAAEGP